MDGKIYLLTDPDGKIRYVGQTIGKLYYRLSQHLNCVKHEKTHKRNWIKSLLDRGEKPQIVLVEDGIDNFDDLNDAEIFYMKKFEELGCKLTNSRPGGKNGGNPYMKKGMFFGTRLPKGYKQSEETIRLKSQNNPRRRPVVQCDSDGNIVNEFASQCQAAIQLGISQGNIGSVLNGNRSTAGGFIFKYKN